MTELNQQEFAANPARLRANQAAIDADTARSRAAVKADMDGLYADLRRHLTTGGPNGGPAVTPPPATIMSRLTDAQQDAVTAQINANIEGRKPTTDPQTWYKIRQGLTADDATERQRWASTNLVPFMGRLSAEDYASLEKLQTVMRSNDGGAEQSRLQIINRMANQALRSVGINPTPRFDAAPDSDAAQAARFHRALQDELSAVESKGRRPTETEAYGIVSGLKDTGIKSGWLKVNDPGASRGVTSDSSSANATLHEDALPPEQRQRSWLTLDFDRLKRMREDGEQATVGIDGSEGAPATEPDPGSPEYQAADSAGPKDRGRTGRKCIGGGARRDCPSVSAARRERGFAGRIGVGARRRSPRRDRAGRIEVARKGAALLVRVVPVAAGAAAAAPVILVPGNSGAELHPMGENLRVRTAPGQRSATVQRRVDDGLFGTGIGAKWIDLPVGAEWASDERTGRRYIAIDRLGLEQAVGRDAADAALGGNGIAEARRPSEEGGSRGRKGGYEDSDDDDQRQETLDKEARLRRRRENRPPPAADLEQRPDRAPLKPPHELSDEDIADIAHKIASGHASKKHREEFPEFGSDTEFEAHVANVIKDKRSENKTTPEDHTAYWHNRQRDSHCCRSARARQRYCAAAKDWAEVFRQYSHQVLLAQVCRRKM